MPQNTIQGGLSLADALAQLREHYESKRESDPPEVALTSASLEALAAVEWNASTGHMSVVAILDQLRDHYARKMREVTGNRIEVARLGAALDALCAVEWHVL